MTPQLWFDASLRIHDVPDFHDEITEHLGPPTECHRKGEPMPPDGKRPWPNDLWILESALSDLEDIGAHLAWIADFARPHTDYLRQLISRGARIDIYTAYCCDHDHCGFGLDPQHLEIFVRLGIRLEVSIMT